MKLLSLALLLFACGVSLVAAQVGRADPISQCASHFGPTGNNPGLGVTAFSNLNFDVPQGATSASGSATLPLYPSWNILFSNNSSATVTDPTIAIATGLDPSAFGGELPSSCAQPSLDPTGTLNLGLQAPGSIHGGSLGYDSSNTASPNVLPASGGVVTETFTVTFTDPRFADGNVTVSAGNGDVSVLSQALPSNLDQGETVSADGNGEWNLNHAQLDKPYVFAALVDVGTAGPAPAPYVFSPPGFVRVDSPSSCSPCGLETTGPSVTVADPLLEGAFTFSVDQTDERWTVFHDNTVTTHYSEQTPQLTADQCKKGGWQSLGVFKNQGDCVSYVATGGKNPPAK